MAQKPFGGSSNLSKVLWRGVAVVALLVIAWGLVRHNGVTPGPVPPHMRPSIQVIGFYQNPAPGRPNSHASYIAHRSHLSTLSPMWYSVNPNGSLNDIGYDRSLVEDAHAHHILVVPLVTNAEGSTDVLWTHATRQRAVENLSQLVKNDHLDGLNIDFELLDPTSRDSLTRFIHDLSRTLGSHKVLAVSVFPLVGVPSSVNGADDYRALSRTASYLVMMAYDHHYDGGPPGPVAPYGWVRDNMHAALRLVPSSHLVLGIGMYGYDWINNGMAGPATTVPDAWAKGLARDHGATPEYVAKDSQNRFTYARGGVAHVVWYMGDRSAKARLALAEKQRLAGIALWRLGDEDPAFWHSIPRVNP